MSTNRTVWEWVALDRASGVLDKIAGSGTHVSEALRRAERTGTSSLDHISRSGRHVGQSVRQGGVEGSAALARMSVEAGRLAEKLNYAGKTARIGFQQKNSTTSGLGDLIPRLPAGGGPAQMFDRASASAGVFGKVAGGALDELGGKIPMLSRIGPALSNPFAAAGAVVVAQAAIIVTVLTKASIAAAGFNHEFLQLKNLNLDKTDQEIGQLNDKVLDLAMTHGFSAKAVSRAYFDIESVTGQYGKSVEDALVKTGRFSQAFAVDMTTSVQGAAKVMKLFNMEGKDLDKFFASNARTVQTGVTTFEQLANVQTEYLGTAAAKGQGYDSANKLFAVFTQGSKNVDIAATQTKGALEDLFSYNTAAEFKLKGVEVFDKTTGKARTLEAVMTDLVPVLSKMSDQGFAKWKEQVGGNEGLGMLLDKAKASGKDMLNTFSAFDKTNVNLEKAFGNAKADAITQWNAALARGEVILIHIGQAVLPDLLKVLDKGNEVMRALSGETEGVGTHAKYLAVAIKAAAWEAKLFWDLGKAWVESIVVPLEYILSMFEKVMGTAKDLGTWIGKTGGLLVDPFTRKANNDKLSAASERQDKLDWRKEQYQQGMRMLEGAVNSMDQGVKKEGATAVFSELLKTSKGKVHDYLKVGADNQTARTRIFDEINRILASPAGGSAGGTSPAGGGAGGGGGIGLPRGESVSAGNAVRNVRVEIGSLIQTQNINTTTVNGGLDLSEVEKTVTKVLVGSVKDSELLLMNE